jgi:hypothetical protein
MSTIKATTLSTQSNATVSIDTVVNGTAKAWVNFNGTGTVAIRRAFNVSSVTDNGTGDYTVNFTTAMPDANYCTQCSVNFSSSGALNAMIRQGSIYGTPLTSSVSLNTGYSYSVGDSLEDQQGVFISIFR